MHTSSPVELSVVVCFDMYLDGFWMVGLVGLLDCWYMKYLGGG